MQSSHKVHYIFFTSVLILVLSLSAVLSSLVTKEAHAQPQQCQNLANDVALQIRPALVDNFGDTRLEAVEFYETYKKLQERPSNVQVDGEEFSYSFILHPNETWVLDESIENLSNGAVVDNTYTYGDEVPDNFILSTSEADYLGNVHIGMPDATWDNVIISNMDNVLDLQRSFCNITLSAQDIIDQTYALDNGDDEVEVPGEEQSSDDNDIGGLGDIEVPDEKVDETPPGNPADAPVIDWDTNVQRVPVISNSNTPLRVRMRARNDDIVIFGVSIEDIRNGTADPGDFEIGGEDGGDFNFDMSNLPSIEDIFSGNVTFADFDLDIFGIEINGIEFYYDFYYSVDVSVSLQDADYERIVTFMSQRSDSIGNAKRLASDPVAGATYSLQKNIYNSRTNPNMDPGQTHRFMNGSHYYLHMYGVYTDDSGNELSDPILVQRMPEYVTEVTEVSSLSVDWNMPMMSMSSGSPSFNLAGNINTALGYPREPLQIVFGYNPQTFHPVWTIPRNADTFNRSITGGSYASVTSNSVYMIDPNVIYYVGLREDGDLISFVQAGRTPIDRNAESESTTTEEETTTETETTSTPSRGNAMQELQQSLAGGLVPCDGSAENPCEYNQAIQLINNIISFIFVLIIPLSAIAFVYAGGLLLFSGSTPDKRSKAKSVFLKVVIGIVIILAAYLIVRIIFTSLGADDNLANVPLDL